MTSSTYTILPDVGGNFLVRDFNDGGVVKTVYLPILREPFTITISAADRGRPFRRTDPETGETYTITTGRSDTDIIRERLRELIEVEIEVGMAQDINFLIEEEEGSPPVKILREQDWRDALRTGRNTFQVVRVRRGRQTISTAGFGAERVFKLAPQELVYDETKYFEPDRDSLLKLPTGETASCAFQYIHQTFGKTKGLIKKAKDFNTIKKLSQTDPPQYRNWITQYQREYNLDKLGLNTQYPVIELESFEDDLYNLEVLDVEEDDWTEEEIFNSMSVLDVIRWSMWAGISCYVIDYDGHYYLSYNHGQISKTYTDTKTKKSTRAIVMKVVNNHAYFVTDSNIKKSVSLTLSKYNVEDFDEAQQMTGMKDKEREKPPVKPKYPEDESDSELEQYFKDYDKWKKDIKQWVEDNRSDIYLSPYFEIKRQIKGRVDLYDPQNWTCMSDINPREDLDGFINQVATETYKDNPPPLPEEFLKDENKTYYLEPTNLNGLVSFIKHNYGISPSTMNGRYPHTIDRATYGKTKIMSRSCNDNCYSKNDIEEINFIFESFPELDLKRIPTLTTIAQQIFKQEYKDRKFHSMFNSNTKRAFFEGEIKAENRVVKEIPDTDIFSVDLKRAYTNSLRECDLGWGVYDGICSFEKYRGEFIPQAFYLVEEKVDEYPLRGVEGLVLYHGCFLRYILDKVDIKFVIKPVRRKDPDYFKKFVDRCEEFEEKAGNIVSAKRLVNNFIGAMKAQDNISNYKIMETESNTTLTRAFYTGSIVSNLDKNTKWNRDYRLGENKPIRLIANPCYNNNIQSAQPIRLQVIDSINEKLYKLYLDYQVVFGRCPIIMTRTDALYIEDIERTTEEIEEFCDKQEFLVEKEKDIKKEFWEYKKTPNTQKQVYSKPNYWDTRIDIDKPWSLKGGAKAIYNLIHTGGGAMINGEAGVGKSELMNYISTQFEENKKLYRWVRLIKKLTSYNANAELEEWRDNHPCFAVLLAPTNKATNRIGGKTLNKGLGIPVLEFEEEPEEDEIGYFEKKCHSIIGGYTKGADGKTHLRPCADYLCIDEVSMINGYFWSLLLAIKHRAPRVKFILCGDIERQLPPVKEEWRNFMGSYLIKELSNFQQINLNYNFRNQLKGNILWDDWSLHPERFKITPQAPMTEINLCYLNKSRKEVIGRWNNILKPLGNCLSVETEGEEGIGFEDDEQTEEIYFTFGTPMIACKSIAVMEIAKNEIWKIKDFDNENITLTYENKEIELSRGEVYKNFYSGYAITIHKAQGDTYEDKYTIWDWGRISQATGKRTRDNFMRKLRYVAQSRSKKPEKNIYYR